MYFHYLVIISPWKRRGPFIWKNLNPLHPRMLCAKFGWNWLSGSGEEDEYVKSLRQHQQQQPGQRRRLTTDKFWSKQLTWAFGSGELKSRFHPCIIVKSKFKKEHTSDMNNCISFIYNLICKFKYKSVLLLEATSKERTK